MVAKDEVPPRRYHDFVLLTLEGESDGEQLLSFTVRVFQSLAGEGLHDVPVPMPDLGELDKQRRRLAQRKLDLGEQIALGQQLTDLLLPEYNRQFLTDSLAHLQSGEGLRLRLRLIPQLRALPWEYIYMQPDGSGLSLSGFLALDPRISIVRHEALPLPVERVVPGPTRQVLIAMASPGPYTTYERLDYLPEEQREIRSALEKVPGTDVECIPDCGEAQVWESITGARLGELNAAVQRMRRVDVLHFSGHGDYIPEMGDVISTLTGEGVIILADSHNQAQPVSGELLARTIRHHGVRLVTLGACKTGERDLARAWSSVAVALLTGSIPCVVAMQFIIKDELAKVFMVAVYQALADGRTIDEAVFQGRAAIQIEAQEAPAGARDWGVPVLYSRVPDGHIFPPIGDTTGREQARQSVEQRTRVHEAWWEWMTHQATASPSQLEYLAEQGESLELLPTQALILLRSAVKEDMPVDPWLGRLREQGAEFVALLDDPRHGEAPVSTAAEEILGLAEAPAGVGRVAHSAVNHEDEVTRHTAALALTALDSSPREGFERLESALGELPGLKRWWRRAELHGAMANADPKLEAFSASQPPRRRFGTWLWRARRRLVDDFDRLVALTLGAALGAGVAIGLFRGILTLQAEGMERSMFAVYFFWCAVLGAAYGLGISLARPLVVGRRPSKQSSWPGWLVSMGFHLRANWLAVLLGTLFFGTANVLVRWFLSKDLTITLSPTHGTAYLVGLGVALALFGLPSTKGRHPLVEWPLRLVVGASVAGFAQWLVLYNVAAKDLQPALSVSATWKNYLYFYGRKSVDMRDFARSHPYMLTGADAVVIGILLTLGIAVGMFLATRVLSRLRSLRHGTSK